MADSNKNMIQNIEEYIREVSNKYSTGIVTEHSYRGVLENLLKKLLSDFLIINEPKRSECGAPDYIIAKDKNIPIAFIEAKDIGDSDLDGTRKNGNKEQFDRYKKALDHIIFTDYLDFHLYENQELIECVRLAETKGNKIILLKKNIEKFLNLISHLSNAEPQKITSPDKLADAMAAKTKLLAGYIQKTLENDSNSTSSLAKQWLAFKKALIHDLTKKDFADIYAQTICYGMFAARLNDKTPETFSRDEAARLIPKTNPFLRKIFQDIAGYDVEDSIAWIVDDLVTAYRVSDMQLIMKELGRKEGFSDPLIYFYEDFLKKYDSKKKNTCGVFYTPQPVVKFIVNAVDEILKKQWNMPLGIADTSRAGEFSKVQILDPATGTGTFLAEIVQKTWQNMRGNLGAWHSYVDQNLLPRINGFEFMMAPYAIAHIKLARVLEETGYEQKSNIRLPIYLTNSLEETDPDTGTFWSAWLAEEAQQANYVKRDTPVMVMIGNPPYNGNSKNNEKWIKGLIESYKKEPGGKKKLNEKNSKWLNNDYVKFIRLGQHYVDKNQEGILAFITANSFLDSVTFRGMRWNLLKSFDEIYILNLHGNSRKQEKTSNGNYDENVFEIQEGVSINIFIKHNSDNASAKSSELAQVFQYDLWGTQSEKFKFLTDYAWSTIPWNRVDLKPPFYSFIQIDYSGYDEYEKGFPVNDLLRINGMGITSAHDGFLIGRKETLKERFTLFQNSSSSENLYDKFNVKPKDGWNILDGWRNIQDKMVESFIKEIAYRPFDDSFIFYEDKLVWRPVRKIFDNFKQRTNIGLCLIRSNSRDEGLTVFITNKITDKSILSSKDNANIFPLYLLSESQSKTDCFLSNSNQEDGDNRIPNLDKTIWRKINKFVKANTSPEQVLDYIYGILHTPSYREKYKDFFKVEFPRIPYPKDSDNFHRIASIGEKLRKLHLMENIPQTPGISFNIPGDDVVTEMRFEKDGEVGKVFINTIQCYENIPESAWNFYIGGYQPAQLWLKNRMNQKLSNDEILHFPKIIAILMETQRLMQELDS